MDDQITGALRENEQLQAERDVYCLLLSNLVRRLEEVHADPRYQGVWTHFAAHGGRYDEPTYTAEFEAARAYLRSAPSAQQETERLREALRLIAGGYIPASFSLDPVGFHERIWVWSQKIAKDALSPSAHSNEKP
jgi:hypothetical protein